MKIRQGALKAARRLLLGQGVLQASPATARATLDLFAATPATPHCPAAPTGTERALSPDPLVRVPKVREAAAAKVAHAPVPEERARRVKHE